MHFHDDTPLELSRLLHDDVDLLGLSEHAAKGGRKPRSSQWRGALVLTALAGIACTPYGSRPTCPGEGGQPWVRVESQHFSVVTDLDRAEAESTARQLEEGMDAIAHIACVHPRTK